MKATVESPAAADKVTARPGTQTEQKLRLAFTTDEVVALTGIVRPTLKVWIRKGWVKPSRHGTAGRGHGHSFSGWQIVAICLLAGAIRDKKAEGQYVGSSGVVAQMRSFGDLDDSLLLAESQQDLHTAERVAAEVARSPIVEELSEETSSRLKKVIDAIDRKVEVIRTQQINKVTRH